MTFPPPQAVAANPDERELLLGFLRLQRELIVATTEGLSEAQARWRPDGRLIAVAGIVNHLTHVEWRWIDGSYGRNVVSRSEEEFVVGPERTLAELVAAYAAARRGDRAQRA